MARIMVVDDEDVLVEMAASLIERLAVVARLDLAAAVSDEGVKG
jgi:hypothetical protein